MPKHNLFAKWLFENRNINHQSNASYLISMQLSNTQMLKSVFKDKDQSHSPYSQLINMFHILAEDYALLVANCLNRSFKQLTMADFESSQLCASLENASKQRLNYHHTENILRHIMGRDFEILESNEARSLMYHFWLLVAEKLIDQSHYSGFFNVFSYLYLNVEKPDPKVVRLLPNSYISLNNEYKEFITTAELFNMGEINSSPHKNLCFCLYINRIEHANNELKSDNLNHEARQLMQTLKFHWISALLNQNLNLIELSRPLEITFESTSSACETYEISKSRSASISSEELARNDVHNKRRESGSSIALSNELIHALSLFDLSAQTTDDTPRPGDFLTTPRNDLESSGFVYDPRKTTADYIKASNLSVLAEKSSAAAAAAPVERRATLSFFTKGSLLIRKKTDSKPLQL